MIRHSECVSIFMKCTDHVTQQLPTSEESTRVNCNMAFFIVSTHTHTHTLFIICDRSLPSQFLGVFWYSLVICVSCIDCDVLTCHSRNHMGVTNNFNYGSVTFCSVREPECTTAKWNAAIIVISHTCVGQVKMADARKVTSQIMAYFCTRPLCSESMKVS